MGKYTVVAGQNLYDVALHLYGSVEGITDLMICNPTLSLDDTLVSGQALIFSDGYEIDADVVAWYKNQAITPAGGECSVYPKNFTLPLLLEVHVSKAQTSVGMKMRGAGILEIDWGDNSPAQRIALGAEQTVEIRHTFDNAVPRRRRIRLFGDPELRTFDLTELLAEGIFLFRPLRTESLTLQSAALDIAFTALLQDVRTIELAGIATEDLQPLLQCKSLASLGLCSEALLKQTVDRYLIGLVEQYHDRRSCTLRLLTQPSGEYREPRRDESGRYLLTTGMEAVWVLTHEESWNEAGVWCIVIADREYKYNAQHSGSGVSNSISDTQ